MVQPQLVLDESVDGERAAQHLKRVERQPHGFIFDPDAAHTQHVCQAGQTLERTHFVAGNLAVEAARQAGGALRQDVIDAVGEGKFHIYPVNTIDEGLEPTVVLDAMTDDSGPLMFIPGETGKFWGPLPYVVIVVLAVLFIDGKLHLDDPVGATSVHLVCGVWGTIAAGIFGEGKSLGAQLTGVLAVAALPLFVIPARAVAKALRPITHEHIQHDAAMSAIEMANLMRAIDEHTQE